MKSNALKGFTSVPCYLGYFLFPKKNQVFETQRPQNSSCFCVGFWVGQIRLRQGGYGHGITMLIVEAVGIGGGGRVEGLGGGRKGKRSGRHRDDHR